MPRPPAVKEWTRERFYGLSAFFARTYEHAYTDAGQQTPSASRRSRPASWSTPTRSKKKVAAPTFLDGTGLVVQPKDGPAAANRREALVRAGAGPGKSPYFKRAIVNRVWQQLMGRGLVEPVDMMHEGNPATHPELLDLLADDFASHGYDLRRLIAVIMQSQAYAPLEPLARARATPRTRRCTRRRC